MTAVVILLIVIAIALIALVWFAYLAPAPSSITGTPNAPPTTPIYSVVPNTNVAEVTRPIVTARPWYSPPNIDTGLLP